MSVRLLLLCAASLACVCFFADSANSQENSVDWNQWRGPNRDSTVTGTKWPLKLQGALNLVWEKSHSPSYSGPVVHDDLVFTTETVGKESEVITAHALATGEVEWTREWKGAMSVPFFAASNGDWIRSTPIVTDDALVILGMRDVLTCLDPKTGKDKWRVDFPASMGTAMPSFGAVCSPLIDGGGVIVQTGGAVVKLSIADGSVIWKTLENGASMMSSGAFSSPIVATLAGVKQLVVQTREELCGVDLNTGDVLWREPIKAFRGMNILTPLVTGDRVFTSAHSGITQLFEIQKNGDSWSVNELWRQKLQAYMSSPVLIGDAIYMHMKNQRTASIAVSDGKINWTSSPFGKYWSMISNGDQILALDNKGELLLIQSDTDSLKILDQQKVANDSWAHLAIQGDLVIVRDLEAIKVFRWK